MKKIISLAMVLISIFSVLSISAYAEEPEVVISVNETDFIFSETASDEFRAKFIADYFNTEIDNSTTYGLTCTLFGHKLESSYVTTITHKVNSSDPRCKENTYFSEACTRCDYTNSTLISTAYISCC